MPEFISTVSLTDAGPFPTFKQALDDFMTRVKKLIEGGTSEYVLNEACNITMRDGDRQSFPLSVYAVADLANKFDMISDDTTLKEDAKEPPEEALYLAFVI